LASWFAFFVGGVGGGGALTIGGALNVPFGCGDNKVESPEINSVPKLPFLAGFILFAPFCFWLIPKNFSTALSNGLIIW
jgi:hypothetical protein